MSITVLSISMSGLTDVPARMRHFYANAPQPQRRTMLSMRQTILSIIPDAVEVVSYGMPAFKVNGTVVAGILAAKNHVGYYPFSGSVLNLFSDELQRFSHTKSALHVPIDKPLSKALLKKLIAARISQCPIKNGTGASGAGSNRDTHWKEIGLAAPARRGLVDSNLVKLVDLKRVTRNEFLAIHGIGANAANTVEREMKRLKISFRSGR